MPAGDALPPEPMNAEVLAATICKTGGNFRLLDRLLAQIERVLKLNEPQIVSLEIVDAARESLAIDA